jgi:hypothetical protein
MAVQPLPPMPRTAKQGMWAVPMVVLLGCSALGALATRDCLGSLPPVNSSADFPGLRLVPWEEEAVAVRYRRSPSPPAVFASAPFNEPQSSVERVLALDVRMEDMWIWPAKGERPAVPANRPESQGKVSRTSVSAVLPRSQGYGIICRQFDVSQMRPVHVTAFEPLVSSVGGVDVVHHMTLQLCPGPTPQHAMGAAFDCDKLGPDTWCSEVILIYDRGAGRFDLPEDIGVRIGAGRGAGWPAPSPYPTLVLEVHYLPSLLPPGSVPSGGVLDNSGIRLLVTPDLRRWDAVLFGISDETLRLPPGRRSTAAYTCPADFFAHQLAPSLRRAGGELGLFAYHLHAHSLAVDVSLELVRGAAWPGALSFPSSPTLPSPPSPYSRADVRAGATEVVGHLDPFRGYGEDQSVFYTGALRGAPMSATSFASGILLPTAPVPLRSPEEAATALAGPCLPGALLGRDRPPDPARWVHPVPFRSGDALTARCVFDTATRVSVVRYGLGLFDEMCAPLAWFFPFDGTRPLPTHPNKEQEDGDILSNICVRPQ